MKWMVSFITLTWDVKSNKHIGTYCENKFTELDQIIISHMVLSVNGLLYIMVDTIFSNGL